MENTKIVGREKEFKILKDLLETGEAELMSIIGRRRVGKTLLVNHAYQEHYAFDLIGIQNGSLAAQLKNFADQFNFYAKLQYPIAPPPD